MTTMFHEQEFDDMPAARFDGQFYDDADLDRVCDSAVVLHVCGVTWSVHNETDGFIPASRLSKLAGSANPQAILDVLSVGWWTEVDGGYAIRSFLKYNKSRERRLQERQNTAARMHKLRGKVTLIAEPLPDTLPDTLPEPVAKRPRKRPGNLPIPSMADVLLHFREHHRRDVEAKEFYRYHTAGKWRNAQGELIANWHRQAATWMNNTDRHDNSHAPETQGALVLDTTVDDDGLSMRAKQIKDRLQRKGLE